MSGPTMVRLGRLRLVSNHPVDADIIEWYGRLEGNYNKAEFIRSLIRAGWLAQSGGSRDDESRDTGIDKRKTKGRAQKTRPTAGSVAGRHEPARQMLKGAPKTDSEERKADVTRSDDAKAKARMLLGSFAGGGGRAGG